MLAVFIGRAKKASRSTASHQNLICIGALNLHADNILETSRILSYPPEAVYAAFTSPDILASWWGPEGFTNTFEIFEFKNHGRWKFVMHGPDGKNYDNEMEFITLIPNTRIVIKHHSTPHFTLTIDLTPIAEGTYLEWIQAFDDSETAQAVKHYAEPANEQNLDKLTEALNKMPAVAQQMLY
jgi:uncharacterized protein YndB with AHSA1/START domain